MTIAYSYIRFSHPDQAAGDSLRRQTEAAQDWCRRNKIALDESTTLRDLGKSAFTGAHRKNPDRHALAAFLKLVEGGKIARGSYLIIENLDRLSREDARPALRLWMDILDAGVNIVQLKPETVFRHETTDMFDVMRAIMELGRGHGESAVKSMRNHEAWNQKRKLAREGGALMTRVAPAWLAEKAGILMPVPERAAAVKKIYLLAANGYGLTAIVKKLIADGVRPFGTSGHWARSYVSAILLDRRVIGEIQLRKADGSKEGAPLAGYYPAVISEAEWHAARSGANGRRSKASRAGKHLSLFSGLIRDARDGGTYFEATRTDGGKHSRVLMNSAASAGRAKCVSFPVPTFEAAILSMLREIDPREVIGGVPEPDQTAALTGEIAQVEAKIAELEAELLEGNVASIAKVLREREHHLQELRTKLDESRRKAAHPLSCSWDEAQTLAGILDKAKDVTDTRLRIRSALRRIVESIYLLILPRGTTRILAAQVCFIGGARRDYLIVHRSARGNKDSRRPSEWKVQTARWEPDEKGQGRAVDLRTKEGVKKMTAFLQRFEFDDG